MKFWEDKSKKQLKPELFSSEAEKLAIKIQDEKRQSKEKVNEPSQIRKFYDEVLRFESMLTINPKDFNNILPYLMMINAKVAYAVGRNLVSNGFKDFISNSLIQVKDKDDFGAFVGLFEAFMGYYKFYDEKNKKQKKHTKQGGKR